MATNTDIERAEERTTRRTVLGTGTAVAVGPAALLAAGAHAGGHGQVVAPVAAPVAAMVREPAAALLRLEEQLRQRIVGQDEVLAAVSGAVRRSLSVPPNPSRPMASFLFLGPARVGKTALAKALAEFVFGSEDALVRLDMRAYRQPSTAPWRDGAAGGASHEPGAGGAPSMATVRGQPQQVLLFDEIEKAHPDALSVLGRVLGDGKASDAKRQPADFGGTIVIVTSTAGAAELARQPRTADLLTRIDETVVFEQLDGQQMRQVLEMMRTRRPEKAP
jgi:ATP-dependent Clp protease ATP-binding subunit ClpA